jgi:hypothetical protein
MHLVVTPFKAFQQVNIESGIVSCINGDWESQELLPYTRDRLSVIRFSSVTCCSANEWYGVIMLGWTSFHHIASVQVNAFQVLTGFESEPFDGLRSDLLCNRERILVKLLLQMTLTNPIVGKNHFVSFYTPSSNSSILHFLKCPSLCQRQ